MIGGSENIALLNGGTGAPFSLRSPALTWWRYFLKWCSPSVATMVVVPDPQSEKGRLRETSKLEFNYVRPAIWSTGIRGFHCLHSCPLHRCLQQWFLGDTVKPWVGRDWTCPHWGHMIELFSVCLFNVKLRWDYRLESCGSCPTVRGFCLGPISLLISLTHCPKDPYLAPSGVSNGFLEACIWWPALPKIFLIPIGFLCYLENYSTWLRGGK